MAMNDDAGVGAGDDRVVPDPDSVPPGDSGSRLTASEDLLTALGAGDRPEGEDAAEDALLALLADWRAETAAAPLPALPSDEQIAAALAPNVTELRPRGGRVRPGEHHHGRRPKLWQAVTGAAAVAAVLVGGLSVAAHGARPGDPLWGVNKTMFSDHAGDVELVTDLSDTLAAADDAARRGDRDAAEKLLSQVSSRLGDVDDAAQRVELMRRRDAIERDLVRVTPSAVPLPAPAPTPQPAVPESTESAVPPSTSGPAAPPPPPPPPGSSVAVVPVPLDGLSTTLQVPVDPQKIQDFLSPTTAQPPAGQGDADLQKQQMQQTAVPTQENPAKDRSGGNGNNGGGNNGGGKNQDPSMLKQKTG